MYKVLSTTRVGQLTGSTRSKEPKWIRSVDSMGFPLLNDTGRWGVIGVDLGANTEHSDGKLYFFFGDVAVEWDSNFPGYSGNPTPTSNPALDIMNNADLVAWTDDRQVFKHGGHLAVGWNFFLPNDRQGADDTIGQPSWRFCDKCAGLFWAPNDQPAGICPKGGQHAYSPDSWKFFLPNDHQGASATIGQPDWRFCGKCNGLFWAPGGNPAGVCPMDGSNHHPDGWLFFLPNQPSDPDNPDEQPGPVPASGQADWRFCANCNGLFWAGSAFKGLCPGAPGGGFHLHAVVRNDGMFKGKFAPLNADDPIGFTNTFETPSGAFSQNGRVFVFVGMAKTQYSRRIRADDPAYGLYLVSSEDPSFPGMMIDDIHFTPTYRKEFLFSPRIGYCPKDANRNLFESHEVRGLKFDLRPAAGGTDVGSISWRLCQKCEAIFWNDDFNGVCWKGGQHEPEADSPTYDFSLGGTEDSVHQGNWYKCLDCAMLFFDGYPTKGLCPAGGNHRRSDGVAAFLIPHISREEDPHDNGQWRFCVKCYGMVKSNQIDMFPLATACVVENAKHDLPEHEGKGVVLITRNWWIPGEAEPGFRLAWMPLHSNEDPRLQDVLYYSGETDNSWSSNPKKAKMIFEHPTNNQTHLSLAWLEGPQRWILLYCMADELSPDFERRKDPVLARTSSNLRDWSEPFILFDPKPEREDAYSRNGVTKYMHWPLEDSINTNIPPLPPPIDPANPAIRENKPGWAYGAFILNRFTEWDEASRILGIYYLLSTGRPYQMHLMHTRLLMPERVNHLKLFHGGNGTTPVDSGLPLQGIFYGVTADGNLEWNRYSGRGEPSNDSLSAQNWHPNTGNPVGRGWDHMLHVFGCGDGIIMAIHPNGNLHWYSYDGNGESDVTGTLGWHPNSGNVIGNGWQNFRRIFVAPQAGFPASRMQIFAVAQNGDL